MLVGALKIIRGRPRRFRIFLTPVLLIAEDNSGRWNRWYREAIPEEELLYAAYVDDRKTETSDERS